MKITNNILHLTILIAIISCIAIIANIPKEDDHFENNIPNIPNAVTIQNGSIDVEMLKKARDFLNKIYPVKEISLDWKVLRDITIKTWKIAPVYTIQ